MEKPAKDIVTIVVGVVALAGYAAFVGYLVQRAAKAEELEWTRLAYVFGGVEAMSFAAAGYFFGHMVNRERAQDAERRADESKVIASEAGRELTESKEKVAVAQANLHLVQAAMRRQNQALVESLANSQPSASLEVARVAKVEFDNLEAMVGDILRS